MSDERWDESVDLLVIGSGAGGLSAGLRASALGSDVLIVEKGDRYGGSTAMSGGVCWVPNNPYMKKVGIDDNAEDALTYLKAITKGEVSEERLTAYMEGALRALTFFEEETWVRFDALKLYTDYYPEAPGGRPGGRTMESRPFDGAKLGEELRELRSPHPQSQILGKFGITAGQAHTLLQHGLKSTLMVMWCFLLYALRYPKRRKYGRDTYLVTGNALIGRLRLSLKDRGVPLWLKTAAVELVQDEATGRVLGAVLERDGERVRVEARQGVVLAAGGFSRNLEMRERYQRAPITDTWSAGNLDNVGDGIRMGVDAGGTLELMKEAWWTPVTMVPRSELAWVLVVEKNLPGTIFVNAQARRFANEAAPYIDVVVDMYEADETPAVPCSMLFDATYRYKYPVGPIAPGYAMPDSRVPRRLRDGNFLYKADTLEELAGQLELDEAALRATVERWNAMSRAGVDEDFGRGDSLSDRYYGDPRVKPNPCMAPIEKPPFYAIKVYPGDLGTKGGLRTDPQARVLTEDDTPVEGLYAVGNCAAAVMGRTYPGAGGTIGPALVFGFIAAEAAHASR